MFGGTPAAARKLAHPSAIPVVIAGTQYATLGRTISHTIYDNGNSGSAKTIDWSNGQVQKVTLTDDCTFSFSNPVAGTLYRLYLIEDGTGGYSPTWTGGGLSIVWDKNVEPTWDTGAGQTNIAVLDYDGTTWRGAGWTPT